MSSFNILLIVSICKLNICTANSSFHSEQFYFTRWYSETIVLQYNLNIFKIRDKRCLSHGGENFLEKQKAGDFAAQIYF